MENQKPVIQLKAKNKIGEIDIYGQIGQSFWGDGVDPKKFKDDLKGLGELERLNVHIHSYGGYVYEGWPIFDAIDSHPAEKHVYVDGAAMSMASVILMAGDTRHIAKNGTIMIHNPATIAFGEAKDFIKEAEKLEKIKKQVLDVYAERATVSRERISEMMDEETYMTAEEALELGFVDVIGAEVEIEDEERVENYSPMVAVCSMSGDPANRGESEMTEKTKVAGAESAVNEQEAMNKGAQAERERVKEILSFSKPGIEDFVQELAASDISVADAKMKVGEKLLDLGNSAFNASKTEGNDVVVEEPEEKKPTATTLKEKWEANENNVQDEFLNFEGFEAYAKANEQGLIKLLGGVK